MPQLSTPRSFADLFAGSVFAREPYMRRFILKLSRSGHYRISDIVRHSEADFYGAFPTTEANRRIIARYLSGMGLSFHP